MMHTTLFSFNSQTIHVSQKAGKLPALVFLHANSMSSKVWQKQWASEALEGYQMVALDWPGHGESSPSDTPSQTYTLPGYAHYLREVIEALQLPSFILVGFSLGGNIAIEALPMLKNCRGIFLTGTPIAPIPAAFEEIFLPHPAMATLFNEQATAEEGNQLINAFFAPDYPSPPAFISDDFLRTDPACRGFLVASVAEGRYQDEVEILRNDTVPIAVVAGQQDQLLRLDYLQNLHLPLWNSGVQVIPEAGHLPQWEQPEAFNQLLEKFVADCLIQDE